MTIPLYKWPDAIDWHDLEIILKEKYNLNLRDFSGRNSTKGKARLDELKALHGLQEGYAIFDEERPYQDYWHVITDYTEINRNGVNSMNLSNEIYYNQPTPEWVKQVNILLREEVKDSPAYDPKKQTLTFYVDW